jgi:hypothetical protein
MGLLNSKKEEDKIDKSKKIGSKEARSILGYMDDRSKRRLKKRVKEAHKEGKTIRQISQEIQDDMGSEMKRKFMHAVKKHAGGGLTLREKRRNLARRKEEVGKFGYASSTVTFAGGDVESSHRVTMKDNSQNSGRFGFVNQGGEKGIGVNDSSRKGDKSGFVNNQGASFAGDSGNNDSGGGKKRGGKKPLGL